MLSIIFPCLYSQVFCFVMLFDCMHTNLTLKVKLIETAWLEVNACRHSQSHHHKSMEVRVV